MSKASMITMTCVAVLLILLGCTRKEGIVQLNTEPPGAHYYVDGIERGTTPAEFAWDLKKPIVLEFRKDGYYSEQELLTEAWVNYQASKGNYEETKVGKVTTEWTVTINRKLKLAPPGMTTGVEQK
jgi:hypothetical protein